MEDAQPMVPAAPFHRHSQRAAVSMQSSCATGQQMTPGQLHPTGLCVAAECCMWKIFPFTEIGTCTCQLGEELDWCGFSVM